MALSKKARKEIIDALRIDGQEVDDDVLEVDLAKLLGDLSEDSFTELGAPAQKWVNSHEDEDDDEDEDVAEDVAEDEDDDEDEIEDDPPKQRTKKKVTKKKVTKKKVTKKKLTKKKLTKKKVEKSYSSKRKVDKEEVDEEDSEEKGWRRNKRAESGVGAEYRSDRGAVGQFCQIVCEMAVEGERDYNVALARLQKTHKSVNTNTMRSLHSIYGKVINTLREMGCLKKPRK